MKLILIPIDFSPPSRHALMYGANLASGYGSKIVVLHINAPDTVEPFAPAFFHQALNERQGEIALKHFEKIKDEIPASIREKIRMEFMISSGPVSEQILNISEEISPDMIVMGMRGGNFTLQRIMGTVTNSVIQRANYPVMVVPENAEIREVKRIAYATNFEQDDIQAIGRVLKFSRRLKAQVRCIHIRKQGDENNDYKQKIFQKAYQHELTMDDIEFENINYPSVVEGLNHFVARENMDLLVMLTHHRGVFSQIFHGSHTRKMALQSKVPLWVFQMGKIPDEEKKPGEGMGEKDYRKSTGKLSV